MIFAQTITVTVNVSDPTSADAVAFIVPYDADRNITAPQKRQWCLNGSAGSEYLTTGTTTHKCGLPPPCLLGTSAVTMHSLASSCSSTVYLAVRLKSILRQARWPRMPLA